LQEDTMRGRFLTFRVGEDLFGLEIAHVTEIISIQPINVLPEAPEHVRGVINLRGRVIPVIDMRLRLKKKTIAYTDRTCIIVVETQSAAAGLIVDYVEEVVVFEDDSITPPPDFLLSLSNDYIQGIGKAENIVLLLDCVKLFGGE